MKTYIFIEKHLGPTTIYISAETEKEAKDYLKLLLRDCNSDLFRYDRYE